MNVKVDPLFLSDENEIFPSNFSTISFEIMSPRPIPLMFIL